MHPPGVNRNGSSAPPVVNSCAVGNHASSSTPSPANRANNLAQAFTHDASAPPSPTASAGRLRVVRGGS